MSGQTAYVFPAADLVDVRRFCGYPAYGFGPGDDTFNRYAPAFETLEYRLANLTAVEGAVVEARLTEIRTLETAIPGAGANLDTDQAAVWHHNRDEVEHRIGLYAYWRKELCNFMGVPPGPSLGGSSRNNIRLVV